MKRSEAWLRIYCAALAHSGDPTWSREEANDTLALWSRRFRKKLRKPPGNGEQPK